MGTTFSFSLFSGSGLLSSLRGGTCDSSDPSVQHIPLAIMIAVGLDMRSRPANQSECQDLHREFWGKDVHSSSLYWTLKGCCSKRFQQSSCDEEARILGME